MSVRCFAPALVLLLSAGLAVGCGPCDGTRALCLLVEDAGPAFLSVQAPADDDVWVVGTEAEPGVSGPTALHFDGRAWESLDLSEHAGAELWWVAPGEETTILVGSEGLILEYNRSDGSIETIEATDPEITFFGVWAPTNEVAWAVGGAIDGGLEPQIWRRDAEGWTLFTDPALDGINPSQTWFKVHGRAEDDLWIVGNLGRTLHWDGSSLTTFLLEGDLAGETLLTVDAGGDEPVAVGGFGAGVIVQWDGAAWVDRSPDFASSINGVCSAGGTQRAVGAQGAVYQPDAGGAWSFEPGGLTPRDYHGCAVSPGGDFWAVGGQIMMRPLDQGVIAYAGPQNLGAPL
ncbi:MAG: hypothetical protein VX498_08400 [Myxococcota bacterium]|nr:hypothetical protein [Myxococcota bacterium]